ncbi:hypothetical protein Taro_054250 [Colocasia esculenta]|uniref:Uncharacterized protein n=1 Tax=Colocasia esculenta TaxID=4460 RepID=A0A843XQI8_COLES|nr:hypothetical protein [Colocasia esculenta]
MFYGVVVWDPWLIVSQIVCLQSLYYLTLGFLMSMLVGTRVSRMSLVYFFDYCTLTASTATGWCAIVSYLLSALAGCRLPARHVHARGVFAGDFMEALNVAGRHRSLFQTVL